MKTTSCNECKSYAFDNAPRCGAKTKRNNGDPCRSPCVNGKYRCRMHGGSKGSGAQRGNENALKHGGATGEVKKFKGYARQLIKESRALLMQKNEKIEY